MIPTAALILLLVLVLVVGGIVTLGVVIARRVGTGGDDGNGSGRRVVAYLFAYGLAVLAATGLARTLGLLIPVGDTIGRSGVTDVAGALSLTLVGVPAFAALALWLRRRLVADATERASAGWAVFVLIGHLTFLAGGLLGLGNALAWILGAADDPAATALGFGVVWTAAWAGIERIRGGRLAPTTLTGAPAVVASLVGLVVAGGAVAGLVGTLLSAAYDRLFGISVVGTGVGETVLELGIWLVLGGAAWWWHWLRQARLAEAGVLRAIYLLVPGVLGGAVTALTSAGTLLYSALEWVFGDPAAETATAHFSSLPVQLTGIMVGLVVWRYHRSVVAEDPEVFSTEVGRAYRYLLAGVGLVAAASGLGVVINALVQAPVQPLAERGASVELLLGGLSALVVAAPVWWTTWMPIQTRRAGDPEEVRSTARRIYLTALAGIGGVVAVVSLIVLLFRLLEGLLEQTRAGVVIDEISAPLGLLVATGLVAAYHISVWRADRARLDTAPVAERRLEQIILVATDAGSAAAALRSASTATVTPWSRADDVPPPDPEALQSALRSAPPATRLLVVASGDRADVIPLET